MSTRKVRVNSLYAYEAVMMDALSKHLRGRIQNGDVVRVVNKFGCPPANTMGMCYVEQMDGEFVGMVCTNSLTPVQRRNGKYYLKYEVPA